MYLRNSKANFEKKIFTKSKYSMKIQLNALFAINIAICSL